MGCIFIFNFKIFSFICQYLNDVMHIIFFFKVVRDNFNQFLNFAIRTIG